ncbi:conserved hypothetical protein [Methylocella silvestris BL2]|uniref:Uncharacterized protein n=1 Tax=Methylocella silvestris (strain DSM 15510 / CIP 108128 / LMG 27833 / NCIMB 13906 / BL2) TaxID=395965 RepID=B8EQI7_METSB|nr:hypothetical protein [Methylocella silvestris]ACK52200.1 conserved hypothetical protein [Methylocella silvestris BL2]
MIRRVLQFIGLFSLASAFALLMIDGWRSFAAGRVLLTQLAAAAALAPSKLDALHDAVARRAPSWLEPALEAFGRLPSFVLLALIGLIALWLAQKPKPKIGYSSR